VVRISMGMSRSRGSDLMMLRASRPSIRGIFRSRRIRLGRGYLIPENGLGTSEWVGGGGHQASPEAVHMPSKERLQRSIRRESSYIPGLQSVNPSSQRK
jgi:hypothetical protein